MRIGKVTGGAVSYYHSDAQGSTRLVTDSSANVTFVDNYLPFGQDSGTPTGTEAYKFIGKVWSSAIGLYYDYQRWYDPSTARFISQDSQSGNLSQPQSFNNYSYALNSPLRYVDINGAEPVDITWLKIFVGLYRSTTTSHVVTSILGYELPHEKWGDWRVYGADKHTIWEACRPKIPGVRSHVDWIAKMDRPNPDDPRLMQQVYHFVGSDGSHKALPEWAGRSVDFLVTHGPVLSKILMVVGVGFSLYDIASAYQQGGLGAAALAATHEAFSWAGAIGGAELGAEIGTMILPGIGTGVGAVIGGVAGGVGMGYVVDFVANMVGGMQWEYYSTPMYGKGLANPI